VWHYLVLLTGVIGWNSPEETKFPRLLLLVDRTMRPQAA